MDKQIMTELILGILSLIAGALAAILIRIWTDHLPTVGTLVQVWF